MSPICRYMSPQYSELRPTNGGDRFGSLGHSSKFQRPGFASCLRYCTDVAQRKPTKFCTLFGRLLGWYTIYTFLGAVAPWWNFYRCKIHFTSKSGVLLCWQRYCTALQQRAPTKLCGMIQGMELRNYGTFAARYFQQMAPPIFRSSHYVGHRPTL